MGQLMSKKKSLEIETVKEANKNENAEVRGESYTPHAETAPVLPGADEKAAVETVTPAPTPAKEPAAAAPVEEPVAAAPVEEPVAAAPVEEPVAAAPVEEPVAPAPIEEPEAVTPVE